MRRFVLMSVIVAICASISVAGTMAIRIWLAQKDVRRAASVRPGTKYLCIGSSLTGSAYIPNPRLSLDVIWRFNCSWQFSLMRLKELERFGALDGLETIVIELSHSTLNQNHRDTTVECWMGTLPMSWRYGDLLPLSCWERIKYFCCNLQHKFEVRQFVPPDPKLTLKDRSKEWIQGKVTEQSSSWATFDDSEKMCVGWQASMSSAICEMLDICKKHHITLIAVRMPMPACYIDNVTPALNGCYLKFVAFLSGQGIPVFDYGRVFGDEYFIDANHLSPVGGRKFTELLYADVLRLPLQSAKSCKISKYRN